MFEKVLYKIVIILPYILLALSFISLILGVVKKSSKEPFILSAASIILGIIIFFIPMIIIIINSMG